MQSLRKKIILITLIAVITVALIIHHHQKKGTHNKLTPTPVRVAHPIQQILPNIVSATGNLVAKKSTIITPRASGYIKDIYFHEGQTVKAGDVLFQLDSQTQKDAVASATAAADLSRLQYQRDKELLAKGYVTHNLVYSSQVTYKQNEASLQIAQTNLAQRKITAPFDGTTGAISVSLGDYVNAGNTLTTLVDNAHLRVEYTLPVKYLNQIQVNQAVSIVSATNKRSASASDREIAASKASSNKRSASASDREIAASNASSNKRSASDREIAASNASSNNHITATVSYIAPSIDQSTQTIAVHAQINNTAQLFKPGEYVSVTQNLGSQGQTLLVPEQALQATINGYAVFVVKNNMAVSVPVKIGNRINGNVIITDGLKLTDEVIIAGENEVKDKQSVSVAGQSRTIHETP